MLSDVYHQRITMREECCHQKAQWVVTSARLPLLMDVFA